MKLADLRKVAVKKGMRIRFPLDGGSECVISERGIAEIPGLKAPPGFNLETLLAGATEFTLEQLPAVAGQKPRRISRAELAALLTPGEVHEDEHDE